MESWPAEKRPRERGGSIQNGVTAASHAILHDLIGLRAGIGAGLTAIATIAARSRDHTNTGALLCGLGA